MSGTIRFDDEHIVKFTLDEESMYIYLDVIVGELTREIAVDLTENPIG